MKPEDVEPIVREEAEKMNLGEEYEAHGYEGVLEDEILVQVFSEMKRRHPRILQQIIREELDFFLAPVK
jgi:hypothetical protein